MWVDNDHVAATRGVLDHLAAQGARRVALLAGPGEEHYTRACVAAYTEWCRRRGRLPQVVRNTLSPHPDGPLDRVLASPERPDAVFGIYDYCGRRALTSAARLGLRVPRGPARRLRERGSLVRVLVPSQMIWPPPRPVTSDDQII